MTVEQVATGANPSSIAVRNGLVAFGRGNDVVVVQRVASGWVEHAVIHAAAPVGKLFVDHSSGFDYAVFQTGTEIWFASAAEGSGWTIEHIDDLHEALVEKPTGYAFPPVPLGAFFVFHTSSGVWLYGRGPNEAFHRDRVGPADRVPTALAGDVTPAAPLVAVDYGAGAAIYIGQSREPVLRTPRRVTAMSSSGRSVFLQFEGDGAVDVYASDPSSSSLRHTQTIPDIAAFDAASFGAFAGSSLVHFRTSASVFAPLDPIDDRVDRDCDQRD